jgi:hypothetical protein
MSEQNSIKRYKVKDTWKDYEVTLQVDLDRLTSERAAMINGFWTGAADRVALESGDTVRAVIRMFGQVMINMILAEGGSSFSGMPRDAFDDAGPIWSEDLHNEDGWGGTVPSDGYGWCGIKVVEADVEIVDYDDVGLEEVANA